MKRRALDGREDEVPEYFNRRGEKVEMLSRDELGSIWAGIPFIRTEDDKS